MFGAEDEDGDFLSPTGGAKLASLFGLDQAASRGNESFQYTAPKQPRKSSNPAAPAPKPAAPPGAPAVLSATAVQAFRYINGQYVKQGKLGAAVLGNHTTKEYKLLLYMSQQKQVTAAKIHIGFVFTVQPNNYCTFYDDQRQNWSLMFETEKAAIDFCKEVCVAKVNSVPSLDAVLVQELNVGEGQAVESGDSLEVAYTGWLLQNHGLGQVFDSNQNKDKLLRLKLGAGKVIKGWEEGMLGMKKAGRRLMVIPPSLAYGSKGLANRIPADSTLVFEAELRRVKFKDSGSSGGSRDSATPSPAPSPAPSVENLASEAPAQTPALGPGRPGEPPLRAKSNSLSEQLANPDSTKAKLISRMAKMGQPMLPFMTGVVSQPESSDSEIEDTGASRIKERPAAPSPVPLSTTAPSQVLSYPHTTQPSALLSVAMTSLPHHAGPGTTHAFQPYPYTQTPVATSHLQRVGQVYPAQTVPYMGSGDVTSFLMTEARQHNTEIRLSVGKVADKVDHLASKIDDLQRQSSLSMGMSGMSMETSMIMHSIQRVIQENECLKKELFEKSSRIEEQTRKIGELINQNQRSMEQSNMLLEQRTDCLKSSSEQNHVRLLQAEQEKHTLPQDLGSGQVHLTEELASSAARASQLQLEAASHQQRALELQSKLTSALQDCESNSARIATLEAQLEELRPTAEQAQAQYRAEKQRRKDTELRLNNMEEELHDLKSDKESLERMLVDRKRKWQAERQSRDEELEEVRRSSQQEVDNLRAQLRKTKTCTTGAASDQLAQLQLELEQEWKGRCETALASAKEKHSRERAELAEQRDALEGQLAQLQDKFTSLKQSRSSEEQVSLQNRGQKEELRILQDKHTALEKQAIAVRGRLEARVAELEKQLAKQGCGDTAGEVKRVMNGVFHSLRGEFELNESYTGQAVLGVIVSTIKNVTLQILSGVQTRSVQHSQRNDGVPAEEEEDDEEDEVKEKEEEEEGGGGGMKGGEARPPQNVHLNGEKVEEQAEDRGAGAVKENAQQELKAEPEDPVVSDPTTAQHRSESLEAAVASSDQQGAALTESSLQRELGETSREVAEEADSQPAESGQETGPGGSEDDGASSGVEDLLEDDQTPGNAHKVSGPPTHPPPPPNSLQESTGRVTSLTEGVGKGNGEKPFFQSSSPTKPSLPATEEEEEEEEEELSLKGRPPPTPLFGEEEDDEDLDWLS